MAPDPLTLPAIHASHIGIWIADTHGRVQRVGRGEAIAAVAATPHLLLNATLTGDRLGYPELSGLDLLELFSFLYPARFAVPTPAGIAAAIGLPPPKSEEDIASFLPQAAAAMLGSIDDPEWPEREGAWHGMQALARQRWSWSPLIQRLSAPDANERWLFSRLPEWEEVPPRGPPRQVTINVDDVTARLDRLTGDGAERRPGQQDYARATATIFAPRERKDAPQMLVAEAGTGIGKTLGYLAPAKQWIDQSAGSVCISTFTKALQRQLSRETERLYPDAETHREKVVVRKGRENYLCLLNLEDALQGGFSGRAAILAQLVARWAAYTRDGDMVGGDLPGWLPALFRRNGTTALTDRRGECIYAGCPHFRKCFIERSARAATQADIVIANHALTMVQAARPRPSSQGGGGAPATRLIFDEGHHLWDAADSMFAAALTGQEAVEIRRWVLGPEGKSRGRRRGLAARLADVASYDEAGDRAIQAAIAAAAELPGDGWLGRLSENDPWGAIERLLVAVRGQVYARAVDTRTADAGYGLETELADPDSALVAAAAAASDAVEALLRPLMALGKRLDALVDDPPDWLDGQARARVDGARHSLGTRIDTLGGWLSLLGRVGGPADPDFVDWLAVDRYDGREFDTGLHRHWLDPAKPIADVVYRPAQGVLVTSATLRNGGHGSGGWADADIRTGARHMDSGVQHFAVPSPFDYARQSEVLIVTDIARGDLPALAGAYSRLIEASGGGALGLFSAIRRLRIVHARIADRLARAGLPLYAQHVDPLDTGTLVDIFRADPHASLLGTDALRDGVDVPGESLRLVVMEGVPWPRPTILHAARRAAQGGGAYDDMVIRGRIGQAFGRLIRRADDFGQFVMLSPSFPSRLLSAFPEGTPIRRLPLDEAVNHVAAANVERRKSAFPAFSPS